MPAMERFHLDAVSGGPSAARADGAPCMRACERACMHACHPSAPGWLACERRGSAPGHEDADTPGSWSDCETQLCRTTVVGLAVAWNQGHYGGARARQSRLRAGRCGPRARAPSIPRPCYERSCCRRHRRYGCGHHCRSEVSYPARAGHRGEDTSDKGGRQSYPA